MLALLTARHAERVREM